MTCEYNLSTSSLTFIIACIIWRDAINVIKQKTNNLEVNKIRMRSIFFRWHSNSCCVTLTFFNSRSSNYLLLLCVCVENAWYFITVDTLFSFKDVNHHLLSCWAKVKFLNLLNILHLSKMSNRFRLQILHIDQDKHQICSSEILRENHSSQVYHDQDNSRNNHSRLNHEQTFESIEKFHDYR